MEETLREVVEALAPLERGAGSAGERQAAYWLAERLRTAGARDVRVEDTPFLDGYAKLLAPLDVAALVAAARALRRGRSLSGALVGLTAAALIADDASNGLRPWRRLVGRRRTTTNVIAECGAAGSDRTLVVLAHHDAAPTGAVFDQRPQRALAARFPDFVERSDASFPLWWPVVAAPLAVGIGALTGRRGLTLGGAGGVLAGLALAVDIARDRVVPGANDNLSACAALVALAEEDDDLPVRLVLASCGAEEVLQGGIYGFVDEHLRALPRDRTWVLNLDTVGSPELIMLEGEGTFVMEDYCDPGFRDAVARAAETASGEPLRRGCRARSSTDSVIPSRAGYPTATLCSWEPDTKCLSNYHLPTDTPDRLDYAAIERAVRTAAQLAHDLA